MGKFKKDNINALCKKYISTLDINLNEKDYITVELHKSHLELADYDWVVVDPINDIYYCLWTNNHGITIKLYRYYKPVDNRILVSCNKEGLLTHKVEFFI